MPTNPLRANLVQRAEDWRYGSLWRWPRAVAPLPKLFRFSPTFISNDDVGVECVMADELPELHDFCGMLASDEISGLSVIFDEVAVMAPADLYLETLTKPPK